MAEQLKQLFSNDKADEIVEAILQTEKLNARQGAANAGKALVVGNDGVIGFGNAGMTDAAKLALMTCLQHVVWDTDDYQTLLANFRKELYAQAVPTYIPVYELSSPITFNRNARIDTNTKIYNIKRDYSMLVTVTDTDNTPGTTPQVIVDCMDGDNTPYPGVFIGKFRTNSQCWYSVTAQYKTYVASRMSYSSSRKLKIALREDCNGEVDSCRMIINDSEVELTETTNTKPYPRLTKTLGLGGQTHDDGTLFDDRYWRGTLSTFKLYYDYIPDDIVNTFFL